MFTHNPMPYLSNALTSENLERVEVTCFYGKKG